VFAADISEENPTATYEGKCFEEITFEYTGISETQFEVLVHTRKPKSMLCSDVLFFANTEIAHVEPLFWRGKHKITFNMKDAITQADVGYGGIKAFAFCEGVIPSIESLWTTFKAFFGGCGMGPCKPKLPIIGWKVPAYMEKANVEFLEQSMNYVMEKRSVSKVEIDPDTIQSGDFFGAVRLDGTSPIIMYGTGARISHCIMALRIDGELYIIESTDGGYNVKHGIMRTKWADWIELKEKTSYHVVHLPLTPEAAAKFDADKALQFFESVEGLPYGYHNFLFGWIDQPNGSYPPLLPHELVPVAVSLMEKVAPKAAFNDFNEALNKRMNTTEDLMIADIAMLAAKQGMSVEDVMAMPEIDGWEYHGIEPRDGRSMVCSAFTTSVYKAAGLFDDLEINAVEFQPRDATDLAFFQKNPVRPQACIDADPDEAYCQLLGNYRIHLTNVGTVEPYAHMNERCGTNWPSYSRDDNC
jgi:hypothetical protein